MVKKVEYSRSINQCNLIITAEESKEIEKDSMEMFRYNKIPHFLQFHTQKKDDAIQFFYDITGMQTLEQILEYQSLNYQFVKKILNSFDQACIQAANYMLTENDIVLLPELLFIHAELNEVVYCYLPGNQIHICIQFKKFMEYLMRHLDHKDKQAVQLVYGVYQQVAEEKSALHSVLKNAENEWKKIIFDNEIKSINCDKKDSDLNDENGGCGSNQMQYLQKNIKQTDGNRKINKNKFFDSSGLSEKRGVTEKTDLLGKNNRIEKPDIVKNYNNRKGVRKRAEKRKKEKNQAAKKKTEKKLMNFFRKKIYTDSYQKMEDETLFEEELEELSESSLAAYVAPDSNVIQNRFIYQGTDRNRDFLCPEGKKVLGSSAQYADICIPLPMVSKVHARIEVNEKGTFLEDMNSANGTQVNGVTLKYREKRILQKGDTVSIAGESYHFC